MKNDCIIALDMGTTAFKAAVVRAGAVRGKVTVVKYALDYCDGRVTCDPELYVRCALDALRRAARTARKNGLLMRGVGLSSQAQTFVALDGAGRPVRPAVVWTDSGGAEDALAAAEALPDFDRTCGFARPSPLQLLPKLMRFRREGGQASRFLLLNEWIAYRLTGEMFGDATNQGMGGLYDISRQAWNEAALALAGITPDNLAAVASAACLRAPLDRDACAALDLSPVPVFSCGNDQSCAAIGAGIEDDGDLFCNFGTALVVYTLKRRLVPAASDDQIAGCSPLLSRWFLLGVESECGNMVEGLATLLFKRGDVGRMLQAAVDLDPTPGSLPQVVPVGDGRLDIRGLRVGARREEVARALLEHYSARLGEILAGLAPGVSGQCRCFAAGGMARSEAWLDFLGDRHGIRLLSAGGEHPGLVGIAKIIRENTGG